MIAGQVSKLVGQLLLDDSTVTPPSRALLEALVTKYSLQRDAHQTAERSLFGDVSSALNAITLQQFSLFDAICSVLGKISAPVFEFVTRGETHSVNWAVPIAVVWARENSKKPYFPAVVSGILEDQEAPLGGALAAVEEEGDESTGVDASRAPTALQAELTRVNEGRMPKHVSSIIGRSKNTAATWMGRSRNKERFRLVEFVSTSELMWVRDKDTLPFTSVEKSNPNYEVLEDGERKKKNFKGNDLTGERLEAAGVLMKSVMEEMEYRMDDPCGDALLDDLDEEAEAAEEVENFVLWSTSVAGEVISDPPSAKLTLEQQEDKEFEARQTTELLLAVKGEYGLYLEAVAGGFVSLYGKGKTRKRKGPVGDAGGEKKVVRRRKEKDTSNPYAKVRPSCICVCEQSVREQSCILLC